MCGIVGAVSERNVVPFLIKSLKLLEYPGFDNASILVINEKHKIEQFETLTTVLELEKYIERHPLLSNIGIANTNWNRSINTVETINSHSIREEIGLVQIGLIEENDNNEIVNYLIHHYINLGQDFLTAIRTAEKNIKGTFSFIGMLCTEPDHLKALCRGSTLVIGLGANENFIASDHTKLLPFTNEFIYLQEGDIADITKKTITIYDNNGVQVERQIYKTTSNKAKAQKGKYEHYMIKEIYDQPDTILSTLQGRVSEDQVNVETFGSNAAEFFGRIHRVQIVAKGSSFHAALAGRYWLESIAGTPCQVEMANESRYRARLVEPNTLFVALSQSGETIETLNALRTAKNLGYTATLAISNKPGSSIVKESDLVLLTGDGTGTNMTSIKDFTTQLLGLSLLAMALGRYHRLDKKSEANLVKKLKNLPNKTRQTLKLDTNIKNLSEELTDQERAIIFGNGIQLPVAMNGAMWLKETSSIYTDAYPADELNQAEFEYVDQRTPILALAPPETSFDDFLTKARDRYKNLIVFADEKQALKNSNGLRTINLPSVDELLTPITYIIPMQLLAYHVAVKKGKNIEKYFTDE